MKNQVLLIIALCLSGFVSAQTDSSSRPQKNGDEWKMPGDAIKRSQNFADNLKKNLGLDSATTKKIFQAYLSNTKPVDEIKVLPITDKEKSDRLRANQTDFTQTIKNLLSPEQFARYQKIAAARN